MPLAHEISTCGKQHPVTELSGQKRARGAVGAFGGDRDYGGRGTSKFRGVSWEKKSKCWVVQVQLGKGAGQKKKCGGFTDEEEAARVYDALAIQHHKHK